MGMRSALLRSVSLLVLVGGPAFAAAPDLPFSQESDSHEYFVRFTDQDSHAFPISQAQDAADALDRGGNDVPGNPRGHHDGFADLGFLTPHFTGDRLVDFWDCQDDDDTPCDNGQATTERIRMPTSEYSVLQNPGDIMSTEMCMRMVLGHELFHHVEFAYVDEAGGAGCGPWPASACEGMARMMQDQIYTDIDTAASSCISAQGEFDAYLDDTNRPLWDLSYTAALFWKYLSEQLGTVAFEPELGADFIVQWWENAVDDFDTPDIVQLTRETIQDFGGAGVNTSFFDFAIANVAKDFDLSELSASERARWSYVDSGQGFGQSEYDAVTIARNQDVSPGNGDSFTGFVSDWGAFYIGFNVDQCPNLARLGVAIDVIGPDPPEARMALLFIRDDVVVDVVTNIDTDWTYNRYVPVEPYTRLVAVIASIDVPLAQQIDVACTTNSGSVDFPLVARPDPTHGGPPGSFAVLDGDVDPTETGLTIPGLDPDVFDVSVGPLLAQQPAELLARLRTPLGYRLFFAQPPGLGAGAQRLAVRVGGSTAAANAAVFVGERQPAFVVALDRSQSMTTLVGGTSRFELAKRAAGAAADGIRDGSQLGLVAFAGDGSEPNDDAIRPFALTTLDDPARAGFAAAVAALPAPSGPTSIGDGLAAVSAMLEADAAPNQERHAILLSDGAEGEASSWDTVRDDVLASDVHVHTIALGANADQGLLAEIATETRGSYTFVDEAPAATLGARLADAFARAADRAEGRQRLFEAANVLATAAGTSVPIAINQSDLEFLRVRAERNDAAATVSAVLRAPDGSEQSPVGSNEFSIPAPIETGIWELTLTATAGAIPVTVFASARPSDGPYLLTALSHPAGAPPVGRTGGFASDVPVEVEAAVVAAAPVAVAGIEHVFALPESGDEVLVVFQNGDQRGDDGVFRTRFRRTITSSATGLPETLPGSIGSYGIRTRATGRDADGHAYERFDEQWFWVGASPATDSDGDGLRDVYEATTPCLDPDVADAASDPDADRLGAAAERLAGTDPCHADTDGGGEHDGSEIARGADPNDPRDDALPAPGWLSVVSRISELHVPDDPRFVPQPFAILLRVPSAPSYDRLLIERRRTGTANPEPFVELARPDPRALGGAFLDAGLGAGATYEYRVRGVDADGNESAPSRVVTATVKADPLAPIGALRVVGGPRTDALAVDLAIDLYGDDDPAQIEMQIEQEGVRGGGYEAYAPIQTLTLRPVTAPTSKLVQATLRDDAGNESQTYVASVLQYPAGSLGSIHGTVQTEDGAPAGGVLVQLAGLPAEARVVTAPDGSFALDGLLPGTYGVELLDLPHVGFRGGVVVAAGDVTEIGVVPVPEPGALAAALVALAALARRYARVVR
jgi:hypothetical protein